MHLYLLMEEGSGNIEIKKIKGNLYAYYTVNKWDKRAKKEIKKIPVADNIYLCKVPKKSKLPSKEADIDPENDPAFWYDAFIVTFVWVI